MVDGQNLPLTTEYTREDGQVSVQSYYLESDGHTKIADPSSSTVLNADPLTRSALYTPASGQRYDWTEGQTFLQTTTDTYSTSAWLGISAFYSPSNIVNSTTARYIGGLRCSRAAYISNDSSYEQLHLQRRAIHHEHATTQIRSRANRLDLVRQDDLHPDDDDRNRVRRCLHDAVSRPTSR